MRKILTLAAIVLTACSTVKQEIIQPQQGNNLITRVGKQADGTRYIEVDKLNTPYLDEIHFYDRDDKEMFSRLETDRSIITNSMKYYPDRTQTTQEKYKKDNGKTIPYEVFQITDYKDGRERHYEYFPLEGAVDDSFERISKEPFDYGEST